MYWELVKSFFSRKDVRYTILICFLFFVAYVALSQFSDIEYHRKKRKEQKNKVKLEEQKQKTVSASEI